MNTICLAFIGTYRSECQPVAARPDAPNTIAREMNRTTHQTESDTRLPLAYISKFQTSLRITKIFYKIQKIALVKLEEVVEF